MKFSLSPSLLHTHDVLTQPAMFIKTIHVVVNFFLIIIFPRFGVYYGVSSPACLCLFTFNTRVVCEFVFYCKNKTFVTMFAHIFTGEIRNGGLELIELHWATIWQLHWARPSPQGTFLSREAGEVLAEVDVTEAPVSGPDQASRFSLGRCCVLVRASAEVPQVSLEPRGGLRWDALPWASGKHSRRLTVTNCGTCPVPVRITVCQVRAPQSLCSPASCKRRSLLTRWHLRPQACWKDLYIAIGQTFFRAEILTRIYRFRKVQIIDRIL